MSDARRSLVPGGTYFFTVTLNDRSSRLLVDHIDTLREAVRQTRIALPFRIDAWVVLPEHMHCVWTLPVEDADYSNRWKAIKTLFSKSLPKVEPLTPVRQKRGERGIWQRRYWEHTIRDEQDFEAHVNYVHLNPVKHGLVLRACDWPYSSFHRYVKDGIYPKDWMGYGDEIDARE